MTYSALWFSQFQFFISLSVMTTFFAISLGLSWVLFYLRLRAMGEQHLLWLPMYRFWVRIFALAYIISFASSMPVLLQLGSLWPQLLPKMYAVSSPILAVTLLGVLLFKAGFLGLMLYAQRQLAEILHALTILLVAIGNTFVGLCVLVLVSWMHTPTGVKWENGSYTVISWAKLLMNPSLLWYGLLMLTASFVVVALLMMAVLSLQSLRRPLGEGERRVFKLAVYIGGVAWVGLALAAWGNGIMVAQYQPVKAAAAMAFWHSGASPEWLWFAWPQSQQLSNSFSLGIPNSGMMWLGHDPDGLWFGLDQVAGMSPPVLLVFWSMRIALYSGALILIVLFLGWRLGSVRHYDPSALAPWQRRCLVAAGFLGPLLLISGMAYQLFGMMPFVVNQTITLTEVFAQHQAGQSALDLIAYLITYTLITLGFLVLVRYAARYGVVSVARHRGRA